MGIKLQQLSEFSTTDNAVGIKLLPNEKFQTITGFGGSFTEASAIPFEQVKPAKPRQDFGSLLWRKWCPLFPDSYSYELLRFFFEPIFLCRPLKGDKELENFSIEEDRDDIIPMIKDAMAISKDGFKDFIFPVDCSTLDER